MPNRFARAPTHAHSIRCTHTHTAANKRRKSIFMFNLYTRPPHYTPTRRPLLSDVWFCVPIFTLPYFMHIYFYPDVIIRDLPPTPLTATPYHHHPLPAHHSILAVISCLRYRILTANEHIVYQP